MNIKQNKGYVGIDMTVGVIILLILVPTIMGLVFGINNSRITTEVKTQALDIIVNTLETAKGMELSELKATALLKNFEVAYRNEYNTTIENDNSEIENDNTIYETTNSAIVKSKNSSFRLEVTVSDYKKSNEDEITANIVKTVTATITYKVGNKEKSMNISTVVR